ncbi:translation initiation factor eIF3 subunit [Savitreella phatthalungensis]
MRPILLQGHERSLTQVIYNAEGDLLFSTSKDHVINVWYSHNGERLGTYNGHQGAIWTVSCNKDSTLLASGSADNTIKLWNVETGVCLKTWEFPTAVKRVAFSEDDSLLLGVTEKRMGYPGSVVVFPIDIRVLEHGIAAAADAPILTITTEDSKVTVAGWSALDRHIITAHENGAVSLYDAKSGTRVDRRQVHEATVTDLQVAQDGTYFLTASKDKTAKLIDSETLEVLKEYVTDTPLNSAAITPGPQELVILGGGQEARDVTTTSQRQGKFEARFYHRILQEEVGRVRGHFGPLNTIAVHPRGTGYASGGEDGYVRVHAFDDSYFKFRYTM